MVKDIYIYENRTKPDFLNQYIKKLQGFGFNPIILDGSNLVSNQRFIKFKQLYEHYSYNPVEFEVHCFARYFAIAALHNDDLTFILSDSDIYVSDKVNQFKDDSLFKGVFVGSEGYTINGSERQISPHFSIWNKILVNDFVDFIIDVYERNKKDNFLASYYQEQKNRLGNTGISDMTLLYMWVKEKEILFINSNTKNNLFGIDHNISSVLCQEGVYKSFFNRKLIKKTKKGDVKFVMDNMILDMAVVHFQGGYKRILNDFYNGNFFKFGMFTFYIWFGRLIKKLLKK